MDIKSPHWAQYEARFNALAQTATQVPTPKPALDQCQVFLCLYGENGLPPTEEFRLLDIIEQAPAAQRFRVEVDTDYWQDTVLFVP